MLIVSHFSFSQPPGFDDGTGDYADDTQDNPAAPIDGSIYYLIASGVLLGLLVNVKIKNQNNCIK